MVYFEFWSHEKIEYRSHEIRPPDPESQLVIICSIAECSAAVRKLFPSKSYSNISWILFMKCTLKNVLCQIWKLILKMKNLFGFFRFFLMWNVKTGFSCLILNPTVFNVSESIFFFLLEKCWNVFNQQIRALGLKKPSIFSTFWTLIFYCGTQYLKSVLPPP